MTNTSDPASRAPSNRSSWQPLGVVTIHAGSSLHHGSLPALLKLVERLNLTPTSQRLIERAVCEAVENAWGSDQAYGKDVPISIRVFCHNFRNAQPVRVIPREVLAIDRSQASSWGFFLISSLESDSGVKADRPVIDLFLYPEG